MILPNKEGGWQYNTYLDRCGILRINALSQTREDITCIPSPQSVVHQLVLWI